MQVGPRSAPRCRHRGGLWPCVGWPQGRKRSNEYERDQFLDGARGSVGADLRIDTKVWRGSGVYLRALGTEVLFSASASRPVTGSRRENYRVELGWHASGHRGGLELFGVVEHLFDDLSSMVSHGSRVAGIGLRLTERYQSSAPRCTRATHCPRRRVRSERSPAIRDAEGPRHEFAGARGHSWAPRSTWTRCSMRKTARVARQSLSGGVTAIVTPSFGLDEKPVPTNE